MTSDVSPPLAAKRLPSLAGLRFVCAIVVFSAHAYVTLSFNGDWTGTKATVLLIIGRSALSFFFVLSGFVMAWSFRPGDTATAFWRRRAAKIYPTHVVTWCAGLILITSTGGVVKSADAVTNLFLLHTWLPNFETNNSVNVVSWSLSCEAFFYLSFPLLHRFLRRIPAGRLWAWTAGTTLAVILLPLVTTAAFPSQPKFLPFDVTYDQYWFVYLFPAARVLEFVLGIVLARSVLEGRRLNVRFWHVIAVLAVAYPVAAQVPYLYSITAVLIIPVAMLVLAGAGSDIRGSSSLVRNPAMVKLGDMTFAFYMVHLLVLQYAYQMIDDGHPASPGERVGSAALLFAVSLALAWAVHTFIEQPLSRRWGTRRLSQPRRKSPSVPRTDQDPVAP
ncbi:acyltransferase family protein [Streptomyces sp. NPDC018000]|uniref:acyltransferase family protein n=1 Tax=Streptomyces sp. NPDC018000 TaxID=3365028 RepID=UPI00379A6B8F